MGDTKRQSHAEKLAMEITDDIERLIEAYLASDGLKKGRVRGLLFANLKALAFSALGEEATLPEPDPKHVNYSEAKVVEIKPGDPAFPAYDPPGIQTNGNAISAAMHEFLRAQSFGKGFPESMDAALQAAKKYLQEPQEPEPRSGMALNEALRILAETHTRDDDRVGFVVEAMPQTGPAAPHPRERYLEAWETVRKHLHMQGGEWGQEPQYTHVGYGLKLHSVPHPNASWSQAPTGYKKLPEGIRCRCVRLWTGSDGSFWCCNTDDLARRNWRREGLTQPPKSDETKN